MALLKYLLIAVALPATLLAQGLSHPVMASRDDASRAPRSAAVFPDTLRVLAVMAQFQADNDPATTGDGRFLLTSPTDSILDAPPHDARYFRDHLTFLENYFLRSSEGKVIVQTTLIDTVFNLPLTESSYAPPTTGSNTPLVNLARDVWSAVDSSRRVPDFSRYRSFIVFHAGVGRDIDFTSVLGYNPGPSDLPSLYLGPDAFRKAYGASFQGIPVNGGAFFITNSIILPETESRSIPSVVGGNVLVQYTINGLLCASLGSYLGLPDLFNTTTGASGIGRFGLMDGQAIFSFHGTFPPEPSAWEKYWLGWITPIVVPSGTSTIALPAVEFSDTVYRIPISNDEYFLVENRNRDPQRTGQHVTSSFNGTVRIQYFVRDTVGFDASDVSGLSGVITDVDQPDWSLPGGVGDDGTFYDGGVLIWHIDESVILQGLSSDAVNANPDHRGVDLEEADGSQDIGQQYDFLSPGSGSEEGTPLDFWYSGNASPVNKNVFSPTSFPDSRSYTGANSHVTIRDFSSRGPRMSAVVQRGDAQVSVFGGFPAATGDLLTPSSLTVSQLPGTVGPALLVSTSGVPVAGTTEAGQVSVAPPILGKLFAWSVSPRAPIKPFSSSGLIANSGTDSVFGAAAAVGDTNADGIGDLLIIGQSPSSAAATSSIVRTLVPRDANGDSLADDLVRSPIGRRLSTPPVVGDSLIAVGATGGMAYFIRISTGVVDSASVIPTVTATVSGISAYALPNSFVVTGSDGTVAIRHRSLSGPPAPDVVRNFGSPIAGPAATSISRDGKDITAFVTTGGQLYLVDASLNPIPGFPVSVAPGANGPPALADLDGDGARDIVVFGGSKIFAFNQAGASLDFFPFTVAAGRPIASSPILGDVDGDGLVEIIAVTGDGLVVAVNKSGKSAAGFPLKAGRGSQSAAVFALGDTICLAVASSEDGSVCVWATGQLNGPLSLRLYPWPQYQHDPAHRGIDLTPLTGSVNSQQFFPKDRAYNWPNPVYDGKTHLRYFVRDNATVSIKIFDLAGDLVTSFTGPGIGGMDNEVEWDASGVQSGVYLARIQATGATGSGVAVVKVAVVK